MLKMVKCKYVEIILHLGVAEPAAHETLYVEDTGKGSWVK
jgi:hypothetical protein